MRRAAILVAAFLLAGFAVNAIVTATLYQWARLWQENGTVAQRTGDSVPCFALHSWRTFGTELWVGLALIDDEVLNEARSGSGFQNSFSLFESRLAHVGLNSRLTSASAQSKSDRAEILILQGWGWPLFCLVGESARKEPDRSTVTTIWRSDEDMNWRLKQFQLFSRGVIDLTLERVGPMQAKQRASRLLIMPTAINSVFYAILVAMLIGWMSVCITMLARMSRPRRVRVVAGVLLVSILTTWAVAWERAFALDPLLPLGQTPGVQRRTHQIIGTNGLDPIVGWAVSAYESTGQRMLSSVYPATPSDFSLLWTDPPESVLPHWWGDFLRVDPEANVRTRYEGHGRATGWPFLALWCGWTWMESGTSGEWSGCIAGIPLSSTASLTPAQQKLQRALPLGIIWPGFALNVVIFSWAWATLLLTIALLAQGRRRYRAARGRCPACGYDLRAATADRCPECGSAKAQPV